MQKEIHPDLKETTITCACGEVYHTKSTKEDIRVEVCSSCHPFYTGKQRQAAKGGRVERFNQKYGLSDEPEFEENEAEAAAISAEFRAEEAEDVDEETEEVEETEEENEEQE